MAVVMMFRLTVISILVTLVVMETKTNDLRYKSLLQVMQESPSDVYHGNDPMTGQGQDRQVEKQGYGPFQCCCTTSTCKGCRVCPDGTSCDCARCRCSW